MFNTIFFLLYFFFTCAGLTFMKLGADSPIRIGLSPEISFAVGYKSLIGYIFYICSFFMFTWIVQKFELSYVMPVATGIVQVLSVIIAVLIFKENLRPATMIGIGLVIAGIVAMNLKL